MNSEESILFSISSQVLLFFGTIFWLVLALFGQTYWILYFLPLVIVGVGIYWLTLRSDIKLSIWQHKMSSSWWLLVVVWLTQSLATIFSQVLGVSLHGWFVATWFVGFWWFWEKRMSVVKQAHRWWAILPIILLAFLLFGLTLVLFFHPEWGHSLPAMNLVFASFGHSHSAALYLLCLPFLWVLAETKKSWQWWLPLIIILIGLVISFGRLALLVGIIEVIALFGLHLWFDERKTKKTAVNPWMSRHIFGQIFISLGLLSLGVWLLFSFNHAPREAVTQACTLPFFRTQLCKPALPTIRGEYLQIAVDIWQNYPWFGAGLDSFGIIGKRWAIEIQQFSAFAHSSLFQSLAETGLVGALALSIFVAFNIVVLGRKAVIQAPQNKFVRASLIAVIASTLNAFGDFDWSYLTIWGITWYIFVIAVIGRNQESEVFPQKKAIRPKSVQVFAKVGNWLGVGFICLAFGYGALFGLVDVLTRINRVEQAFSIFPWFHWHGYVFLKEARIVEKNSEKLQSIFKNNLLLLAILTNSVSDPQLKQKLKTTTIGLDPQNSLHSDSATNSLQVEQLDDAIVRLDTFLWYLGRVRAANKQLSLQTRAKLADQLYQVANLSLGHEKYVVGRYYRSILEIAPCCYFSEHQPWIATLQPADWLAMDEKEIYQFAEASITWQDPAIGWLHKSYARLFVRASVIAYEQQFFTRAEKFIIKAQTLLPNDYWTQSLMGHYWVARQNPQKALEAYTACQSITNVERGECYYGILKVKKNGGDVNRFQYAARKVLGVEDAPEL